MQMMAYAPTAQTETDATVASSDGMIAPTPATATAAVPALELVQAGGPRRRAGGRSFRHRPVLPAYRSTDTTNNTTTATNNLSHRSFRW